MTDHIVTRVDKETGEETDISIRAAMWKLGASHVREAVEPMLLDGATIHTPYATYTLKTRIQ